MFEKEFVEEVHNCFCLLVKKHNLKEVFLGIDNIVRYENDEIYLDVIFDSKKSYELGVNISSKKLSVLNERSSQFFLETFLQMKIGENSLVKGSFCASNLLAIKNSVSRMAEAIEKFGTDLLKGDMKIFEELESFQKAQNIKNDLARILKNARREAEEAWIKKDYAKFLSSYKHLLHYLSPAEKEKFNYAQKKCLQLDKS